MSAAMVVNMRVWSSMQPFADDWPSAFAEASAKRIKQVQLYNRSDAAYALAKKHKVKLTWGTDVLKSNRIVGVSTP
jgi:hypothetical protein